MNIVRRLKRLEAIGGILTDNDPLFYACKRDAKSGSRDWRAVSHGRHIGEVENTPELQALFARWEKATAELIARSEPPTL